MTDTLLIGSGNAHKAAELVEMLRGLPFAVVTLASFPHLPEPDEIGDTFETNALIKAIFYRKHTGLSCVADDSGLEVDALDGEPGVYSARYAGPGCTYDDNNRKLLDALARYEAPARTARFVCCAAYAALDGDIHIVRGTVEGQIVPEPRGKNGFGYDPLFVPDGHDRTFAEMNALDKHAISHRGRAFQKLRGYLERHVCQ